MLILGVVRRGRGVSSVLLLLCVLGASPAWAGDVIVHGAVVGPQGSPLAGALVRVTPDTEQPEQMRAPRILNEQCDRQGAFQLSLPPGSYRIRITRIDRRPWERRLRVTETPSPLRVVLYPRPMQVAPVRVAAPRFHAGASAGGTDLDRFGIDRQDVKNKVGGMEDVMRSVHDLPGVSAPSDLHGEFFVRGSHAGANVVFLDGVEVMFPYHILGFNSVFSPGIVDRATFYNANAPAEYAAGHGGVLVIESRGARPLPSSGDVGLSWLSGHMHATVGNQRHSAAFSMRRSYHDKLVQMLGSVENQQIPSFHEVHLRARWQVRPGHEISAGMLWAGDGMSIPSPELQAQNYALVQEEGGGANDEDLRRASLQTRGARLWVDNTLQVFSLQHRTSPRPGVHLQTTLGWVPQRFHFSLNARDWERTTVRSHVGSVRQSARWVGQRQRLHFGWRVYRDFTERRVTANAGLLQLRNSDTSVHLRDQHERHDFHRWRARGAAMFHATYGWKPVAAWDIEGGMRFEHDTLTGQTFSDPRLALTWEWAPTWTLRLGWARTHTLRDKFVEIAPSASGAPLRAEAAATWTLGLKGQRGPWDTGVTAWTKQLQDLVYEAAPAVYANGAEGRAKGVDLWLQWRHRGGWTSRLQYSWSRTLQRNPVMFRRNVVDPLTDEGPRQAAFEDGYWFHPVQDLRHQLAWGLSWQRGAWRLGSQLQIQSGRPWTPVVDVVPDHRGRPVGVEGRRNSSRLPPFVRLDARVSRAFEGSRARWNVYAEVLNLTRSRNVYQYRYDPGYDDRIGIMMLPAMPTLGFEAHF